MPPRRTRAMLAEASLQGADLVLFSTAGCDEAGGTVEARRWRNGGLETARVPLPPLVVILSNPIREEHHRIGAWIRANTAVIEDHGPDKLDQVRFLAASPLSAHAIPAERLDPDDAGAQLAGWAARHGGIVVKPVDGMRGGNVHFLVPGTGGDWSLRTGRAAIAGALPELIATLRSRVAGRLRYRDFMVQRYVRSAFRDCALTIRVDVVRRPEGGWRATRRVARLGVTGSLATNTAAGSAQMFLERFLAFAGRDAAIADRAEALAVRTASLVADAPGTAMIEAGVDLALGEDDRLSIIEVNVRPEANWAEQDRAANVIAYLISRLERAPGAGAGGLEEARE